MSNNIATPERIRSIVRSEVIVEASDPSVLDDYPEALDETDQPSPSFFTKAAHAQVFVNERLAIKKNVRPIDAIETTLPLVVGEDFTVAPNIPLVKVVDKRNGVDRLMKIAGYSVDFQEQANALELHG